jgi:tryptophan synthase beta chain
LKDATNEAFRVWASQCEDTFYVIGSVVGAHPYPFMVREFQRIIGDEVRVQCQEKFGRLPSDIIACVGGGSNAMGIFTAFIDDRNVNLWGVEAAGRGLNTQENAAALAAGSIGVLPGSRSYLLQTNEGQVRPTHSVSAGLDYPGVGPELAYLKDSGRAKYVAATDAEALAAFRACASTEGIIPALETAHALAYAEKLAKERGEDALIVVNMSGRGDKDVTQIEKAEAEAMFTEAVPA